MSSCTGTFANVDIQKAGGFRPRTCVWEITLACNLRCGHCGSRAGRRRDDELDTEQALGVAHQLADMGCEIVTLAGGEPTVRKDWDTIAKTFSERGVYVNMITNGVYKDLDAARDVARRALAAGMGNVGVSLDGPEAVHDSIRGEGTFQKTLMAMRAFHEVGVKTAVLTTINKQNLAMMRETKQVAADAGANIWRTQLALPMGTMEDHREDILTPQDLLTLMPLLAELKNEGGIQVMVSDSLGYYGTPDKVLRGRVWKNRSARWAGCQAGLRVVGIEADGNVKGCLAMQANLKGDDGKNLFIEGNLKQETLEEIWTKPHAFAYNREPVQLTGKCGECKHGTICRGGARCVAGAMHGGLTENRYCYSAVAGITKETRLPGLEQSASVAAAALLLAIAPLGCGEELIYGVPADMTGDTAAEVMDQALYGVPVDVTEDGDATSQDVSDTQEQLMYGVPVDVSDSDVADADADAIDNDQSAILYGVPVDVTDADAVDNDQSAVLYGVPADI